MLCDVDVTIHQRAAHHGTTIVIYDTANHRTCSFTLTSTKQPIFNGAKRSTFVGTTIVIYDTANHRTCYFTFTSTKQPIFNVIITTKFNDGE